MMIYHYTKGIHIENILKHGKLLREGERKAISLGIENKTMFGFQPQVWFTTESEMPFTACPMISDNSSKQKSIPNNIFQKDQMAKDRGYDKWDRYCGGVYRLKFNSRDIRAETYIGGSARKKMKQNGMLQFFEQVAKMGNDNLNEWYHCKNVVDLKYMKSIECRMNGVWTEVSCFDILCGYPQAA